MDFGTSCPCMIWHGVYRVGGAGCACRCHSSRLTADEQADLAIVAARARQDRGDIQPMLWDGKVIPWRLAVDLEVA